MSAQTPGRWVIQQEASQELGISTEAVRMRVRRGSLESRKDDQGRVVVWVVADRTESAHETAQRSGDGEALVEELRRHNEYLRARLEEADTRDRENRRLLAAALERMPELEAPQSPERSKAGARSPTETSGGVRAEPETSAQRPWWRRIFGG